MRELCLNEITKISGGISFDTETFMKSVEHFSFRVTIGGAVISACFGALNNRTFILSNGSRTTHLNTFLMTFYTGLGVSWGSGLLLGVGIGAHQAYNQPASNAKSLNNQ